MHKSAICVSVALCFSSMAFSQMILHDPVSSRMFESAKYSDMKGTPFYIDKWLPGTVTTSQGTYTDVIVKYDVYGNALLFNKNDEAFEFKDEVLKFYMIGSKSDTMFFAHNVSIKQVSPKTFVQVLEEGKLSLYRSDLKLLTDINQINKGVVKSFSNTIRYYVVKNNQSKQISLGNQNEVLELPDDQCEKVAEYLSNQKISFSNERGIKKLFSFYNSL